MSDDGQNLNYYEEHAAEYHARTFAIDPSLFLQPLADRLEPGATVLDIGCGSGRDLLWLKRRGFSPIGIERSPALAAMAAEASGCPVIPADFFDYPFSDSEFDSLLLVGSLVHVPHEEVSTVLSRISGALRNGGLMLLTLKEGRETSISSDGRVFYLWQKAELEALLSSLGFTLLHSSRNESSLGTEEVWLDLILRKGRDE